jgi:peptide/nickel transport system permease protein
MKAWEEAMPPATSPEEDEARWSDPAFRRGRRLERLRRNPSLLAGLAILGGFAAVGLGALLWWGNGLANLPTDTAIAVTLNPSGPSPGHPLGVINGVGVDVLSGLLRATPFDLGLVGGPILMAAVVGGILGTCAGFFQGWVDLLVTGAADVLVGIPSFLLIFVLYFGVVRWVPIPDRLLVFGVLFGAILWPYYARPVRAIALEVSGERYVEAARAAGATRRRLVLRHVLPNSLSPVFAQAPVDVYTVFFVLTVFPYLVCSNGPSFSALTVLPTTAFPEWGNLLALGTCHGWSFLAGLDFWWMYLFPLATIVAFGIGISLLCDGADQYVSGR